jgi:hypothetical protein
MGNARRLNLCIQALMIASELLKMRAISWA